MVYDAAGNLVGVADEGYSGSRAITSGKLKLDGKPVNLPEGATVIDLGRVDTTPGFYREAIR
jgi:hypothetical protein